MKKKLGLILAMATVLTIGGVYATWSYSQGTVDVSSGNAALSLTGMSSSTSKGKLEVVGTSSGIKVDDTGNYKAGLTYDEAGYFTVTFTPSPGADETVKQNGIAIQWYVGYTLESTVTDVNGDSVIDFHDWQYAGAEIFTEINNTKTTVETSNLAYDSQAGTFSFKIPMEDVVEKLTLNNIVLNDVSKYTAFNSAIANGDLHVYAMEAVSGS